MSLGIFGLGTAVPKLSVTRDESVQRIVELFYSDDGVGARMVSTLNRVAGVDKRHSVVLQPRQNSTDPPNYDLLRSPLSPDDRGPSTAERMAVFAQRAHPLAYQAAINALNDADFSAADITHLVTVTCTGLFAPGVDVMLSNSLGLRPTLARTNLGFMGCHAMLSALRVANGFVHSDPGAKILVVSVELPTLHYRYATDKMAALTNALFGDGAAAVVVSGGDSPLGLHLRTAGTCLIPNSQEALMWRVGNHGFDIGLSQAVPKLIEANLRLWADSWLATSGMVVEDIPTWAVHPGGPAILQAAAKALNLPKEALEISQCVLRDCGNMSSATIAFILERLRFHELPVPWGVLVFGPGVTVEGVVLDKLSS